MTTFRTAAAAVTMLTLSAFAHPTTAQTLRIYHIDIDQGDATLLVSPAGNTLLVDSGRAIPQRGAHTRAVVPDAHRTQSRGSSVWTCADTRPELF